MSISAANRIDAQRAPGNHRLGNLGVSDFLPPGLALTQIVSGVMENWGELEAQMPWNVVPLRGPRVVADTTCPEFAEPAQSDREPVRQKVVQETSQSLRPLSKDEKAKGANDLNSPQALVEGEEGLLGEKARVGAVKESKVSKMETVAPTAEKGAERSGEVAAQAALNFRAPEMPKVEGQSVPASFAVPNHSAGASGFGSTWSHAAAKQGQDNVIHSE